MGQDTILELDDLVYNPTPRLPVSLCLDCSGSMNGQPIDELNEGVRLFYQSVREDEKAQNSVELSIVTFGPAQLEMDFTPMSAVADPPQLTAFGTTPLGTALKISLDTLDARKDVYKYAGVDYYQPWLVVMTDGCPCDEKPSILDEQAARIASMINARKLTVFAIGTGPSADMGTLARISPTRTPLKLRGLEFREFFTWLSKSVSVVSRSMPGDSVPLDVDGLKGWAEI